MWGSIFYLFCVKSNGNWRGGLRLGNGENHKWAKCQNLNHGWAHRIRGKQQVGKV